MMNMATNTVPQRVPDEVYARIDNDLYDGQGDIWWKEDSVLSLLKASVNPCRFPYYMNVYRDVLKRHPAGATALDVGCGGGILSEEFAAAGFNVTGIDPSENSLRTARKHAELSGLTIDYREGSGEDLRFADASFDVVYCCDVLEHVRDLPRCVAEIARVLRPGGVFFYDTFNRNPLSRLVVIKIWQEWRSTAFMPPNLHVYEMLIKPEELRALMTRNGLGRIGMKGMAPNVGPLRMISLLRKRARGRLTYAELGRRFQLKESNDLKVGYMGYAVKEER